MAKNLLGVHCSTSGGAVNAFDEAETLGINTFQIFSKNQRQWREKVFKPAEIEAFKERFDASDVEVIFSHCTYLFNLASGNPELVEKSINGLIGEVRRCNDIGLSWCVLHPGSAKDIGLDNAIIQIADGLKKVLEETSDCKSMILLENTAGQGATVGREFIELKGIMDEVKSDRIGVCFDTCHAFAAGYDIRRTEDIEAVMNEFDQVVGLDHLKCLHFNDSKGELASNLDRHENIGQGNIGQDAFAYLMKRFPLIPKVLETPKGDMMDIVNLNLLRKLAGQLV